MASLLDIGSSLPAFRRAAGLTQAELGRRLGVPQSQIARWEASGFRTASLSRVDAVARALGLDVAEPTPALLAAEQSVAYLVAPSGAHPDALKALARTGTPPAAIAAFARSHGITRLELFGSVLTEKFRAGSDVDVLVSYDPDRSPSLLEISDHETELSALLRRPVDLVSRPGVEASSNEGRRLEILGTAKTLYARP